MDEHSSNRADPVGSLVGRLIDIHDQILGELDIERVLVKVNAAAVGLREDIAHELDALGALAHDSVVEGAGESTAVHSVVRVLRRSILALVLEQNARVFLFWGKGY